MDACAQFSVDVHGVFDGDKDAQHAKRVKFQLRCRRSSSAASQRSWWSGTSRSSASGCRATRAQRHVASRRALSRPHSELNRASRRATERIASAHRDRARRTARADRAS